VKRSELSARHALFHRGERAVGNRQWAVEIRRTAPESQFAMFMSLSSELNSDESRP
jgi:hypothetical protein